MKKIIVIISMLFCVFVSQAQNWNQFSEVMAFDKDEYDSYGNSVCIYGNYAIVGACNQDTDGSGMDSISEAGAAYIYKKVGEKWQLIKKLVCSIREKGDFFGCSVAINNEYAIVGAWGEDENALNTDSLSSAGAVYVFSNNNDSWEETQKIVASKRYSSSTFGYSVAISGDYFVTGAKNEDIEKAPFDAGAAYVFKNNGGVWEQVKRVTASDYTDRANFGCEVDISGDYIIIGADYEHRDELSAKALSYAGAAYIFHNTDQNGDWQEVQKIVASDRAAEAYFGGSVAISENTIVVGVRAAKTDLLGANSLYKAGAAYVFTNNAGVWKQTQKLVSSDR